jgi:hypothetical protein
MVASLAWPNEAELKNIKDAGHKDFQESYEQSLGKVLHTGLQQLIIVNSFSKKVVDYFFRSFGSRFSFKERVPARMRFDFILHLTYFCPS